MKIFRKISQVFLRVGVSLALLIFLFNQVDKKSLFGIIKNADFGLLLLAAVVFLAGYMLCLVRWWMLLRAAKVDISWERVLVSFSGGIFFNLILPSTIGGDIVRGIDLVRHTKKSREVVATVLLDRLSGYTGLVVLTFFSLVFGFKYVKGNTAVLAWMLVMTLLLIVMLLVIFNKTLYSYINNLLHSPNAGRVRRGIRNLHREMHYFREHQGIMFSTLIISLLVQITLPLVFYFISRSLGLNVNIIYFLIFVPIIGAIALLPVSIGGLGLRDASTVYFFTKIGVSRDLAFTMSLLSFLLILVYGAIGGLIYVFNLRHRRI